MLSAPVGFRKSYLALFCLCGSTGGYDYAGGRGLADVRCLLLDPVRYAEQEAGKDVQSVPKDGRLAPEGRPEPDIMLVTEPRACWMVRVLDHLVFLPSDGNSDESAPFSEWFIKKLGGRTAQIAVAASWVFQEFGVSRAVPVHLACADRHNSLVGLRICGTFPNGNPLKGVCASHAGESAVLLCAP